MGKALCLEVEENAKAAIEERGWFSLAIPGGSVAKALAGLKDVDGVGGSSTHVCLHTALHHVCKTKPPRVEL